MLASVDDRVAHEPSGDAVLRGGRGEARVVQKALEQRSVARGRLEHRLDLGIHLLRRGGYGLVQDRGHCTVRASERVGLSIRKSVKSRVRTVQ